MVAVFRPTPNPVTTPAEKHLPSARSMKAPRELFHRGAEYMHLAEFIVDSRLTNMYICILHLLLLPRGLMARRLTLDQFIEVRILAGQPVMYAFGHSSAASVFSGPEFFVFGISGSAGSLSS